MDLETVSDVDGLAEKHGVSPATRLLRYDFVLVTEREAGELRELRARESLAKHGVSGMRVVNGTLTPE